MFTNRKQILSWLEEDQITVPEDFLTKGICHLLTESELELSLEVPKADSVVYMFILLQKLQSSKNDKLLKAALNLNTMQNETRGASVGYNPDVNGLVLCYAWQIKPEHSKENFFGCISQFTETAENVKEKIEKFTEKPETTSSNTHIAHQAQASFFNKIRTPFPQ